MAPLADEEDSRYWKALEEKAKLAGEGDWEGKAAHTARRQLVYCHISCMSTKVFFQYEN